MQVCSRCGGPLGLSVPAGDNRERHVCSRCGAIHYQNPKVVAGCLAEWQGRVLLCRRAIEPRRGFWTLPAGFLENGESVQHGARRETLEEANARVEIRQLYTLFSLPHIDQIYMMFRGELLDDGFSAGDESLEVRLFEPGEIPWEEIAFLSIAETLRYYVEDHRRGEFVPRIGTIELISREPRRYRTRLLQEN